MFINPTYNKSVGIVRKRDYRESNPLLTGAKRVELSASLGNLHSLAASLEVQGAAKYMLYWELLGSTY